MQQSFFNPVGPSIYGSSVGRGERKQRLNDHVKGMVERAKNIAQDTVREYRGSGSTGRIGNIHIGNTYSGWFWGFPSWHRVIVVENKTKAERERENRTLWGIVFGVTALGVAFLLGRDWGMSSDAGEELDRVYRERKEIDLAGYVESRRPYHGDMLKIKRVLTGEKNIFQRIRRNAQIGLALKVSMFASCMLGVTGAIVAPPLMVAAGVSALVGGCGMLIHWGFNSTNRKNLRDAEQLRADANELLNR